MPYALPKHDCQGWAVSALAGAPGGGGYQSSMVSSIVKVAVASMDPEWKLAKACLSAYLEFAHGKAATAKVTADVRARLRAGSASPHLAQVAELLYVLQGHESDNVGVRVQQQCILMRSWQCM